MRTGILTIGDRVSQGACEDKSGPALRWSVEGRGWKVEAAAVVPDEVYKIGNVVIEWCERYRLDLILTTGGVGAGPRDITPEAMVLLFDKELPGFGELMRRNGAIFTELSYLSRGTAGIRGNTLIVCLPGSASEAVQSLDAVAPLIRRVMHLIKEGAQPAEKETVSEKTELPPAEAPLS